MTTATTSSESGPLFLGLDSSTQALKASLLDESLRVLSELEVRFDDDLPHFGTKGGVLTGEPGEVFSPVMQPVEAMDMLLDRMKEAGWPVGRIRAVSAAGQQHASVYWSQQASTLMANADSSMPLRDQLSPAFSRPIIPNWQDSSTVAECSALTIAAGGPGPLAQVTGSAAHTRFTGAQIMKFARSSPDAYASTSRISLVSSYITTLLCLDGEVKGIDESDACGMNLYDIPSRTWSSSLLATVDPSGSLAEKLGDVEKDAGRVVGHIGRWFQERYGFSPECVVLPGTGDNPATFLSLNLGHNEGMVSLGTSDVVLVSTAAYNPHPEFHAFYHPALRSSDRPRYFNMLVYKNGSLAREHVRNAYFNRSWEEFNSAVERLRPKQSGDVVDKTAFWWLLPDIIPAGAKGVFKYVGTDAPQRVADFQDKGDEALAILSSQMLNYASRSHEILDGAHLSKVYATGGAARNPSILGIMADALGCSVAKSVEWVDGKAKEANWNACSVGVAFKAAWGWKRAQGGEVAFDDFVSQATKNQGSAGGSINVAEPTEGKGAYEKAIPWWQSLEKRSLDESLASPSNPATSASVKGGYGSGAPLKAVRSPEAVMHPPRQD